MNLDRFFLKILMKSFLSFVLLIGLFFCNTQVADSSSAVSSINSLGVVVEHLRVKVPKQYQQAWLSAEKQSWEPWLATKSGFIDRKLFWDQKNEEATLLISWSNRRKWKNIPKEEIDLIQKKFENIARQEIGDADLQNPFPLTFQGELLPQ